MKSFSTLLLRWYDLHKRSLPWRDTQDPYHILISEIMLQQTQVQTVIPYYHRFLKSFPTFQKLANASQDHVLKNWEGLGYYSRARNLHALAKKVVTDYNSKLPSSAEDLKELPGIGPYTTGALLSIAFQKPYAVVDGNVERVLARHLGFQKNVRLPKSRAYLWEIAQSFVPMQRPGDYNQALMELGATICTPTKPSCPKCPIQKTCRAKRGQLIELIPIKEKAKPIPHLQIGAGVIFKNDLILIAQRKNEGLLGGLWEFPGGKLEKDETLAQCVKREIWEELGIRVSVGKALKTVDHTYSHFKITLHPFLCKYLSGKPQTIGCQNWKWIKRTQLKRYAFPKANQPIIQYLQKLDLTD